MVQRLVGGSDDASDGEIRLPPYGITDAQDREIWIRTYDEHAFESLVEMYTDFDTAQRAQGVPPVVESSVREWLQTVLEGPSVVATHDEDVIGHVMLVPDDEGAHELAIFVHQRYQNAGIGTDLMRAGLGHAQSAGVTDVWLQVERSNVAAQTVYRKVGFRFDYPTGSSFRMSRQL